MIMEENQITKNMKSKLGLAASKVNNNSLITCGFF